MPDKSVDLNSGKWADSKVETQAMAIDRHAWMNTSLDLDEHVAPCMATPTISVSMCVWEWVNEC